MLPHVSIRPSGPRAERALGVLEVHLELEGIHFFERAFSCLVIVTESALSQDGGMRLRGVVAAGHPGTGARLAHQLAD